MPSNSSSVHIRDENLVIVLQFSLQLARHDIKFTDNFLAFPSENTINQCFEVVVANIFIWDGFCIRPSPEVWRHAGSPVTEELSLMRSLMSEERYLRPSRWETCLNSLRPRQNGRLFADDTFRRIFLNENIRISTRDSLKFVPKGLINNIPALVLIMAWRRPGDKPLSEPMMVSLPTHICVARPQWVN